MKCADLPSRDRLRELLNYDAETGIFTWRIGRPKCSVGARAGRAGPFVYRQIMIDGIRYYEHRLAWLYVFGVAPKEQIDHRNFIRDDNRIGNLREATNSQNHQHQIKANFDSASGILGVRWTKGKWQAQIRVKGKEHYLGRFFEKEAAQKAYVEAKAKLHPFAA